MQSTGVESDDEAEVSVGVGCGDGRSNSTEIVCSEDLASRL